MNKSLIKTVRVGDLVQSGQDGLAYKVITLYRLGNHGLGERCAKLQDPANATKELIVTEQDMINWHWRKLQ
jgi:hypothetical protein